MITTINNKHKKLNFSSEREQSQACLNSAEHEKNQGRKVLNVPNLRFLEFQGEWEKCKLGDICAFLSGGTPKIDIKEYWDGTIPFVSAISMHNTYISDSNLHISEKGLKNGSKLLKKNNLLLLVRGSMLWKSIPVCLNESDVAFNQDVKGIIPNDTTNNKFLLYWLKSKEQRLKYMVTGTGLGAGKLDTNDLLSMSVYAPSMNEQDKIAKLLSLLDERIATQNKIIEDLKKLKSAISKKLLCNDKWTTCIIQDIAEIGRGRVISSVEIDRQKHPLYPVYSSQTSNNGIMGYLDNYMFDGEYITWTTDGANAGTVFYRKGKFNCTNVCGTLKILPKFDCYFVSLVLQQATQKYVSSNLANPKLMNNTMASIKIKMPNIETQKQLSKVFQALDGCLSIHQRTCEMYLKEKQYLLRQMFI